MSRFLSMAAVMRQLFVILLACCLGAGPAPATMTLSGVGRAAAGGGGCSQATTFLARTSGLSVTETSAYTAMICGMVADGVWSKLDALYIFATKDQTTAWLNLVSTNFTISPILTVNFVADQGYMPGAGAALDTTMILSTGGLNYSLNGGSYGVYDLTSRTSGIAQAMGVVQGAAISELDIVNSGNAQVDINDSNFPTVANANTQGLWFVSRTSSTAVALYKNGASFGSFSSAVTSVPTTFSMYIAARNNAGTLGGSSTTERFSAAWIGGSFSSTDVANFSARLNAYMTVLGINVY